MTKAGRHCLRLHAPAEPAAGVRHPGYQGYAPAEQHLPLRRLPGTSQDQWIAYEPARNITLQADTLATGFGIRVLTDSSADIRLNALRLTGPRQRVTVDGGGSLTLRLIGSNSLEATGTDAVLNLAGALTITGESGERTLLLKGPRALAAAGPP